MDKDKHVILIVAGFIVGLCALNAAFGVAKVPDRIEQQRPAPRRVVDVAVIQTAVRYLLKDPDSAQFGAIAKGFGDAWCGTVNARNSFGGYSGHRRFVISPSGLFASEDRDPARLAAVWAAVCYD